MKVAVYSIVRDRLPLTRKSFKTLREWAGMDFDLYVADNASAKSTERYLKDEARKGNIHTLVRNNENIGQNLAANDLLDLIQSGEYSWVLRWDNDAMPRTRRFLKKLVRLAERCGEYGVLPILTPKITKLLNEPPVIRMIDMEERELEQVQIAGGICRLHSAKLFDEWRFSRFGPLGYGEAAEMAQFAQQAGVPILRVPHIKVEHAHGEDGQIEQWPEEFTWERREVGRYVSYGL